MNPIDRLALEIICGRARCGSLTVRFPDGTTRRFEGARPGPHAELAVHDLRLIRRLIANGAIGLADGWIAGEFDSPDLASVIELLALQFEPESGPWLPGPMEGALRSAWRSFGRRGTPRGPLRTTVEHYDLGNAFFEAWLDETMTYSSALFERHGMTLEEAQLAKYQRLASVTGLEPGMRVLEIGSGWGGFAVFAAEELGCQVTTITVSKEQAAWVDQLIARRGLTDRIAVRLEDFLATTGSFDAVVSIEMIESIPSARWPEFFRVVPDRLRPGRRAGLQIITVADRHWESSNANPDFIRRYVFPGSQVPSPGVLSRDASAAHLGWIGSTGFGRSYAETLAAWRTRFDAAWPQIAGLGFDDRFKRMWQYYLSYCEGGFRSGRVDVSQIVLERAGLSRRSERSAADSRSSAGGRDPSTGGRSMTSAPH
jgi:cyclopropane-fatty-acyl-phospholipid synthase